MVKSWERNMWRYLEPWLAELVWLDPTVAAARLSPEPPPPPVLQLHRFGPFESGLKSREGHSVA